MIYCPLVVVFFSHLCMCYNDCISDSTENCEICEETLVQLESIDDDAEAVGIRMVKTDDQEFMEKYGIEVIPSVIYFEGGNPSVYHGDPREESELLTWILYQMKEDTIENINRDLMVKFIDDFEFLAVFFCKYISPNSYP